MQNETETVALHIRGMRCASCVGSVERALRSAPGVVDANVNLATEEAAVAVQPDQPDVASALIAAVRAAGYDADVVSDDVTAEEQAERRRAALRAQTRRLVIAIAVGLPVLLTLAGDDLMLGVIATLGRLITGSELADPARVSGVVLALLAGGVFVSAAGPMMSGALRAVLHLRGNMDLLVTLGALTAYGRGVAGIAYGRGDLMTFHAAVMIVLFVAFGKLMESRARGRASAALEALLSRIPHDALRVVGERVEKAAVSDIAPGDIVRIPAHETIPVDGEVVSGEAAVDESMLTGESEPARRVSGSQVFGGARVLDGCIDVRATATGNASAAARIAKMVREAQNTKPPVQRLADRAAAVFVPAVLLLALATLGLWLYYGDGWAPALNRMITVMVVACPCALGLAVPTAISVGITRAAEKGIFIRDPAALEAAGSVNEVVIDKTGTLTVGVPSVIRVEPLSSLSEIDVLRCVASLEQLSSHPLGAAITQYAKDRDIDPPPPDEFASQAGAGLSGVVEGRRVVVGSAGWLEQKGVKLDLDRERHDEFAFGPHSVAWAAIDGQPAAAILYEDALHPESHESVQRLKRMGVLIRVLSGDRRIIVSRLARELKIKAFEAEMTPAEKLQRIRSFAGTRFPVMMVGDGINDAPALAAATVGVAIGTGADVAREAADICLAGHSPRLIPEAIRISRVSMRVMKQNLFLAVIYNSIALPAAMFTNLNPEVAAALMMLSSLSVVFNSLRLRTAI